MWYIIQIGIVFSVVGFLQTMPGEKPPALAASILGVIVAALVTMVWVGASNKVRAFRQRANSPE